MYKLLVGNEKGGVGKTTLATHIAAGLASRGRRVLLVDTDPQGHATIMWGLKKEPGLYDLLVRDASFRDVVRDLPPERYGVVGERLPDGRLSLLPSNVESRNIANSISNVGQLGLRLEEVEEYFDVVVLDTSPTPTMLHSALYIAADGVLYPTKPEFFSYDGLKESWGHRLSADGERRSLYRLPPLAVIGIVPVMVEELTVDHSENLARLRAAFGDLVWPSMTKSILWSESTTFHQPVYQLNPAHKSAFQVWELIDRVEEAIYGKQTQSAAG